MWRADDDVAGVSGGVEFAVRGEIEPELRANTSEAVRLGLKHDGESRRREGAEDFLAFTETITQEYGGGASGQGVTAEGDEVGDDFGAGGKDVARESEGSLHDERIGVWGSAGLCRVAWQEFEIASVKQ